MSRTLEYEKLLVELNAGELPVLELKIVEALLQARKGLTRKGLIRIVFREEPQTNLGNDTRDRKIRKGIGSLRNVGIPIVSTSDKAGYKLDTNPENIQCMIKEWESGIARLQHRVDAAQNSYLLSVKNFDTKRDGV